MRYQLIPLLRTLLASPVVWGGVIVLIVILVIRARIKKTRVAEAAAEVEYSASDYDGNTTIFINGGAPASGNKMGTITVDGKAMDILYTEMPLEISLPAGRHHVVVEGGRYGDARLDRGVDLRVLDVWTIDLPGRNDADLIRHQIIDFAEYRSALSSAGYQVTRKRL